MNPYHDSQQPEIAYLLDSFPVLSQTFVLQEILELQRQGLSLRVFSLFKPATHETATGAWSGQIPITYLSHQSRSSLLIMLMHRFLKAPRSFLRTTLLTLAYHDPRSAFSYLCYGAFVAEQIEQQGIAHLHAHFAIGATSVAQIVHQLTDIPYSFMTHAYDIFLSRKPTLAYKMGMAHFVATCSIYNQHYLQQLATPSVAERIHCLYVGLNLQLFPPDMPMHTGDVPLIFAVSRLVEKKGLFYLVSACGLLKDQGYHFRCRIVGDGPQRPLLEQTIRNLGLTDFVELPGPATHEQVIEMYQQATIVALPCIIGRDGDRDGIPNALMEAMYMQIPVVSTPVSGIPELISDAKNGLLVPPQNSSALASALARLLDDPSLCRRLGAAGRETIQERFDVAKNAQYLRSLFFEEEEKNAALEMATAK